MIVSKPNPRPTPTLAAGFCPNPPAERAAELMWVGRSGGWLSRRLISVPVV
jgi:hypothetical protein